MLSLFSQSIFLVGPHQIFLGYFLSPFVSLNNNFIKMFAVLSTSPVLPDTFSIASFRNIFGHEKKAVHKANARQMKTLLLKNSSPFCFMPEEVFVNQRIYFARGKDIGTS
jgi:hypothetical protein